MNRQIKTWGFLNQLWNQIFSNILVKDNFTKTKGKKDWENNI